MPDKLDFDEGAALTVNYLTAYRALTRTAKLQKGQKVVISGAAGSVGHALIQVAKALGGEPIGLVSTAEKARRAREAGALAAIDLSSQDPVEAVLELTDGRGADLGFDPVGGPMLGQLLRSVRRHGAVVLLGFTGGKEPGIDAFDLIAGEKRVEGYSVHAESDEDVAEALAELTSLVDRGGLKPVIDTTVSLNDFEQGYGRLASRNAIGSVVLRLDSNRRGT